MGGTRLKLILAAVLLAANLILVYEIVTFHYSSAYLPQQSMEHLRHMLAENGISVSASAIDTRKPDLQIYEGVLGSDYYARIAETLSGSKMELYFNAPNGFVMSMENGARFSFKNGFGIRYAAADAPETAELAALSEGKLISLNKADARKLKRTVDNFLQIVENETGNTQRSLLDYEMLYAGEESESGIRYCICAQKVRGTEIVGLVSAFAVFENEVIGIDGNWCFAQMDTAYSAQLLDQINILYSVKNRVLEERAESGEDVVEIEALHLGYAAYFRADSDRFYLIPVWNTDMNNGSTYSINAVDGSLYTN